MTFEDQKNILQCLRDVLELAYNSAEPVCCGRSEQECCGSPEPEWAPFEQTIMDTLGPAEKVLAESVERAANQQEILDGSTVAVPMPLLAKRKADFIGQPMGVIVRNDAGALAAVTDLGRVTWLDDCVAGPVGDSAQGAVTESDAPAYLWDKNGRYGWAIGMNSRPQPAQQGGVPEGYRLLSSGDIWEVIGPNGRPVPVSVELWDFFSAAFGGSTNTTSPGSEWVRCSERLPTEADADALGFVWTYSNGLGITVLDRNSFTAPPFYTHWKPTGLKRPQPPRGQEGEGDE